MPNWEYVRKQFPVFKEYFYLNTASRGAISTNTIRQVQEYYELSTLGDTTLDDLLTRVEVIREQLANFINANCDEIAFISNSSLGMNFAAQLFIDEGEVITMSDEFPSVTLPWLQQKFSTTFVKSQSDGKIKLENIENCINQNTKFVVTSYV